MTATAVTLRSLTPQEYAGWQEHAVTDYARQRAEATGASLDAMLEHSRAQHAKLLPDGASTAGMYLRRAVAPDGAEVGFIWLGAHPDRPGDGYVWALEVTEARRGEGFGRAIMLAAEDLGRELGWAALSLNVFGPNTRAQQLYRSLGYAVTSMQLAKPLGH